MKRILVLPLMILTAFATLVSCQKKDKEKSDSSEKCCSVNEVKQEQPVENIAVLEVQEDVLVPDDDEKLDELRVSAEEALKSLEIQKDLIEVETVQEQKVE